MTFNTNMSEAPKDEPILALVPNPDEGLTYEIAWWEGGQWDGEWRAYDDPVLSGVDPVAFVTLPDDDDPAFERDMSKARKDGTILVVLIEVTGAPMYAVSWWNEAAGRFEGHWRDDDDLTSLEPVAFILAPDVQAELADQYDMETAA